MLCISYPLPNSAGRTQGTKKKTKTKQNWLTEWSISKKKDFFLSMTYTEVS